MRSEYVVAEMLQRLEEQGAGLRPNAVEIVATLNRESKDDYPAVRAASAELTRALDAFVTTTETLEGHIVAHDGMGALGESLGELVLRGRVLVIGAELGRLCEAFSEPTVQARTRGWFVGRYKGIADMNVYIRDQLAKIHARWKPYRADEPQLPGITDDDRTTLYRMMIRVADRALRQLWREPELARFIENGLAATDLTEVHLACRQIVTVVGLEIRSRRIRARDGAMERR